MRILPVIAVFCAICAAPAAALETARSLAASGAPRLALARVERLQPRETTAPRWAEWEALRLSLLVELKRNDEALKRAAALPDNLPKDSLRSCLLSAARAGVATGRGVQARTYAARVLWQLDPPEAEVRTARLLVIESYVAEKQGEGAFRAMLRYEQDYRPLDRDTAAQFVNALLDLGLDKEAVNWLSRLEDASAIKLRLQLRSGLIGPDAAIAQARAQLARLAKAGGGIAYWQVLAEAAARQGNGALRLEALERLLNNAGAGPRAPAQALWQAYLAEAQVAANGARLLAGEDLAWADYAARRAGANPQESRALFAHLVRNGALRETRMGAQLQLAFSLYQGGLDHAALQLFAGEEFTAQTLDPHARQLLGDIADRHNDPALTARFWQGLAPLPGPGAEEWQVRYAAAQWRTGATEAAIATMRALAKTGRPLPAPAVARVLALAQEMQVDGKAALAEEMLAAQLPLIEGEAARDALSALGGFAESAGQFGRAADYYLRAAIVRQAQPPDAKSVQARLAAALNLARAGLREDARAQFQWVIGNSKDAAQVELARRELARL